MSGEAESIRGLSEFEARVIELFCDGVKLLGLPKSIGEIYGLLYVTGGSFAG
jgi:DNA-binding transcriptional regulator GbsR (MarR family)